MRHKFKTNKLYLTTFVIKIKTCTFSCWNNDDFRIKNRHLDFKGSSKFNGYHNDIVSCKKVDSCWKPLPLWSCMGDVPIEK